MGIIREGTPHRVIGVDELFHLEPVCDHFSALSGTQNFGRRLLAWPEQRRIFFLVFLFGVRSSDDALTVIKWLLLGALFANLATVADNAGIVNLGFQERIDGRTQGAMGESNQYAAFIILFIGNPRFYLDVADDPAFLPGYVGLLVLYAIGFWSIRRMIDLKV